MSRFIALIVALCISVYTAVMGYSLGVVAETDASVTASFLRQIVRRPATNFSYAPKTWKKWQDGAVSKDGKTYSGYMLNYPRDFDVRRGDEASGNLLGQPSVTLAFPDDAFRVPVTNYGGAFLTVATTDDQAMVKDCYANPLPKDGEDTLEKVETVNGITYHRGDLTDAAAGNAYKTRLFRTIQGLRCYEVALTVRSGNIGNYMPGTVQEFDDRQAFAVLEKMLGTLSFTEKNPNL